MLTAELLDMFAQLVDAFAEHDDVLRPLLLEALPALHSCELLPRNRGGSINNVNSNDAAENDDDDDDEDSDLERQACSLLLRITCAIQTEVLARPFGHQVRE